MSSPTPLRPARAGRHHPLRLGSSVSYLFLTLLAANQAAARDTPSLPYLKQGAPMALRFAPVRPRTPTPPSLVVARAEAPNAKADAEVAASADSSPPAAETPAGAENGPLPGDVATSATSGAKAANDETGGGAVGPEAATPGEARFLPDTYARPAPPVRVEDLLPYFLPTGPARSRAGYEQK